MTKIADYETEDGQTDWTAYDAAKKEAGETCLKCGSFILFSKGHPTECRICKDLTEDMDEVTHSDYIRCPHCREQINMHDDMWEYYEEGEHNVSCHNCGKDFEISTHVKHTFTSPAIVDKDKE